MNYPCRLISEKRFAYLWALFTDVRTITGCFILFFFGSWWSLPSSHYFTPLSSHLFHPHPPRNSHAESWYPGYSKRIKCIFPAVWPLPLKSWSASALDHLSPLLPPPCLSPLYPWWAFSSWGCLAFEWQPVGNGTFIVPQWWKWILSSEAAI